MSNVHVYADVRDCGVSGSTRPPFHPIETLRLSAVGLARRLIVAFQHRRTMQRISRFSDYRLRDIGFERDWDGSIIRRLQQAESGIHLPRTEGEAT